MNSEDRKDDRLRLPGLKRYYAALGAFIPIVAALGVVAPAVVAAVPFAFVDKTKFPFGEPWNELSLWGQLGGVVLLFALIWLAWCLCVTVLAAALSLGSRRWKQEFWVPKAKAAKKSAIRSLKILKRRTPERPMATIARPDPLMGRRTGPGRIEYGSIITIEDINDRSWNVVWKENRSQLGKLTPGPQGGWDVRYGQREGIVKPQFVQKDYLGSVSTAGEGVELLRQRASLE